MAKKIDSSVIKHVKIICYEIALGDFLDAETRKKVKEVTEKYLNSNGYKINWVKCDEENNPPGVADCNQMIIHVSEEDFPGSTGHIIHKIIL